WLQDKSPVLSTRWIRIEKERCCGPRVLEKAERWAEFNGVRLRMLRTFTSRCRMWAASRFHTARVQISIQRPEAACSHGDSITVRGSGTRRLQNAVIVHAAVRRSRRP